VYSVMISCMCILQNYHSKVRGHIHVLIATISSVWWELLGSTFSNFQIYNTVLLTIVIMLYIISSELTHNWKFVPFNYLHPSSPSPDFFSFINCINSQWGVFNLLFHVFMEYINQDIVYLRCEYLKITQRIER